MKILGRLKLRHLNRFLFNPMKIHVSMLKEAPTLAGLIEKIQKLDIEINVIFDVGAHKGKWSQEVRRKFPSAQFFLFEPNQTHNDDIKSRGFTVFNTLLGAKSGLVKLFYEKGLTGDSYYPEKNPLYQGSARNEITYSLSDLILEQNLPIPDLLKIDTQGSELDILKGAQFHLNQIKILLLELPITQMNLGAPSLSEVNQFLEENDFVPLHLTEIHNLIGILVQIDIAYLSRDIFIAKFGHDDIYHRSSSSSL